MKTILNTNGRVERHTDKEINDENHEKILKTMKYYSDKDTDEITEHIEKLDKEWDIERILETNASSLVVLGILLGTFVNKKWYTVSGIVGGFLLQHAVQGWCPPLPLFRKIGVRTLNEINEEKAVLKYLRGDYDELLKTLM